jgi:hypothetical protein
MTERTLSLTNSVQPEQLSSYHVVSEDVYVKSIKDLALRSYGVARQIGRTEDAHDQASTQRFGPFRELASCLVNLLPLRKNLPSVEPPLKTKTSFLNATNDMIDVRVRWIIRKQANSHNSSYY